MNPLDATKSIWGDGRSFADTAKRNQVRPEVLKGATD
jgi:hypothetical protein